MARRPFIPSANQFPSPPKASEAELCPKCHGQGEIVLMRRPLSADIRDSCPNCHGFGIVHKVSCQDLEVEQLGRVGGAVPIR